MLFGASTFIWTSPFSNEKLALIDHAKALGFDILEICVEDPATIDSAAILARLKATGMKAAVCGAFGPDRDLSAGDSGVRENGLAYLRACIAIAAALGAGSVVGPMYSAVGKTRMLEPPERQRQWALAVASVQRAAAFAADHGVRLGLEPLNRFETDLVNTVDQGLRMVADIDRPNVGLLLDTFHMNIEEKDIPAALRRAAGHIVEFHACSSDRGTPGEDHLPWPDIVRALREGNYQGPVVIEAFTPAIKEIARAVALWRPLAESEDALASNGLRHLKTVFAARRVKA
jgi:D-psicose/D-tagatose/L-ribulose 3-epimerase